MGGWVDGWMRKVGSGIWGLGFGKKMAFVIRYSLSHFYHLTISLINYLTSLKFTLSPSPLTANLFS